MALWGEIPHYIHVPRCPVCHGESQSTWRVREYIARHFQLTLPFAGEPHVFIRVGQRPVLVQRVYRDNRGRKVETRKWFCQPRKFPPRNMRKPGETYDTFRRRYVAEWIARREALGLPSAVTDPFWIPYLTPVALERKIA